MGPSVRSTDWLRPCLMLILCVSHFQSLENKMQVGLLKIHVARRYFGIMLLNFKLFALIILSAKPIDMNSS